MKKVMIIDNNQSNVKTIDLILSRAGFKTDCVLKPEFALNLIKESKPNLILLNVNMPEINGFQLCKMIKKDNLIKNIPIIFVSALSDVKYIVGGLALGAVDYITIPIKSEELVARVTVHVKLAKIRNNLQKTNDILQSELNLINIENLDAESDFIYSILKISQGSESKNDIDRIKKYIELSFEGLISHSPYKESLSKDLIIDIIKKYL